MRLRGDVRVLLLEDLLLLLSSLPLPSRMDSFAASTASLVVRSSLWTAATRAAVAAAVAVTLAADDGDNRLIVAPAFGDDSGDDSGDDDPSLSVYFTCRPRDRDDDALLQVVEEASRIC